MVVVQGVKDGFALPAELHQLGVLEDAQLVAHGALGHAQQSGQVANAQLAFKQGVEDADAGRIAEDPEHLRQVVQAVIVGHQAADRLDVFGVPVLLLADRGIFGVFGKGGHGRSLLPTNI